MHYVTYKDYGLCRASASYYVCVCLFILFVAYGTDGLAAQLVIAHKTGIIQSNLSGQSAEMVLDSRSSSTGNPDCKLCISIA